MSPVGTFITGPPQHGLKVGELYSAAPSRVGTVVQDEYGNSYMLVKYTGTVVVNDNLELDHITAFAALSGNAGRVDAVSTVAGVSGEFALACIRGTIQTNVADSLTKDMFLGPLSDANGDMLEVLAADDDGYRAVLLENTAAGLARVYLV